MNNKYWASRHGHEWWCMDTAVCLPAITLHLQQLVYLLYNLHACCAPAWLQDMKQRREDMRRALEEAQRSIDVFDRTLAAQLPGPSVAP